MKTLKTTQNIISSLGHSCNDGDDLSSYGYEALPLPVFAAENGYINYNCNGSKRMDDGASGATTLSVQCRGSASPNPFNYTYPDPIPPCVDEVNCSNSDLPALGAGMTASTFSDPKGGIDSAKYQ